MGTVTDQDKFAIEFAIWIENHGANYDFQEEINHTKQEYLTEFKRTMNTTEPTPEGSKGVETFNTVNDVIELRKELERVKLLLQNCNGDIIRADRENAACLAALKELIPIATECTAVLINGNLFKRSHEDVMAIISEYKSAIERAKKLAP